MAEKGIVGEHQLGLRSAGRCRIVCYEIVQRGRTAGIACLIEGGGHEEVNLLGFGALHGGRVETQTAQLIDGACIIAALYHAACPFKQTAGRGRRVFGYSGTVVGRHGALCHKGSRCRKQRSGKHGATEQCIRQPTPGQRAAGFYVSGIFCLHKSVQK